MELADIAKDAKRAILQGHPMLGASELKRGLDATSADRGIACRPLLHETVLVLPIGDGMYPAFQFDFGDGGLRVLPIVAEINQLLDAAGDPWGVASWWLSPTSLDEDSRSPAQLAVAGGHDDELRAMTHDLVADCLPDDVHSQHPRSGFLPLAPLALRGGDALGAYSVTVQIDTDAQERCGDRQ